MKARSSPTKNITTDSTLDKKENQTFVLLVYWPVCALSPLVTTESPVSKSEQTIWELEHSYWRYVQENNRRRFHAACFAAMLVVAVGAGREH